MRRLFVCISRPLEPLVRVPLLLPNDPPHVVTTYGNTYNAFFPPQNYVNLDLGATRVSTEGAVRTEHLHGA